MTFAPTLLLGAASGLVFICKSKISTEGSQGR